MRLALPIGLLGLLALGVLILIYLLKPKFVQREVSSTHIWKLSLKYRKQKIPFEWLNSIVLILQILAFILASLMIAQPFIPTDAKTESEKVIILESSASMLATNNGISRFERAKNQIIAYCGEVVKTHLVSIIVADNDADDFVIYRANNQNDIKELVQVMECDYGEGDIDGAFELAYSVLERNSQAQIVFYSSRDYHTMAGVEVKNMSLNEWNASILDFYSLVNNNYHQFSAVVASYNKDDDLTIKLSIDGVEVESVEAKCRQDEETTVKFLTEVKEYFNAKVSFSKADSFEYDNSFELFTSTETRFLVQYASNDPAIFFNAALIATQNKRNMTFDTVEGIANAVYEGYDLYIFEGVIPAQIPTDGAVLFMNCPTNIQIPGIEFGTDVRGDFVLSEAIANAHTAVTKNLIPSRITVSRFKGVLEHQGFDVALSVENQPALLIKNEGKERIAVLTFSNEFSNIGAGFQFPTLFFNLFNYFLPNTIEAQVFNAGTNIKISSRPSIDAISVSNLELNVIITDFPKQIELSTIGKYKITQIFDDPSKNQNEINFFVRIPRSQSDFSQFGGYLPVNNYANLADENEIVGTKLLIYFAFVLFALLILEWWLQYREQ